MSTFTLTPAQAALLPTDEDVAAYDEQGYYVSKEGVLPAALIDEAWDGAHRFYEGERDAHLPTETGYSNWKKGDGDGLRNNEFVSLQKKELKAVATYPLLGAIAARLTRSATIRLLDDQLFYKPSKPAAEAAATISGWHADQAYWPTCSSNKMITAWIPFHTVEPERSPLIIIARSHRFRDIPRMSFNNKNLGELEEKLRAQGHDVRVATMTLKKGQCSFHHGWTIHASSANTSGQPRLSLALHMQDGDNHYRRHVNAEGREVHMFDEQLCRKLPNGDPDFSDPAVFPTIWSSES
jgi:ectoine hydroxylase-related dioxygenase (phytanoyl-CoA dioxygenase family)